MRDCAVTDRAMQPMRDLRGQSLLGHCSARTDAFLLLHVTMPVSCCDLSQPNFQFLNFVGSHWAIPTHDRNRGGLSRKGDLWRLCDVSWCDFGKHEAPLRSLWTDGGLMGQGKEPGSHKFRPLDSLRFIPSFSVKWEMKSYSWGEARRASDAERFKSPSFFELAFFSTRRDTQQNSV